MGPGRRRPRRSSPALRLRSRLLHGWLRHFTGGGRGQGYTFQRALRQNDYDEPVVSVIWSSNTPNWWGIQDRAAVAAERFADWLDEYLDDYPDTTVRLVGHSMGADVALRTLNELAGSQTVDSVAMLGAAIDPDAVCAGSEFAPGIENAADEVYNYHSENDSLVCDIYGLAEFGSGIGCRGSDCSGGWFGSGGSPPDAYADVDVTDSVDGHCAYMRPDGQGCVDEIVANFDSGGDDGGYDDDGWFGSFG